MVRIPFQPLSPSTGSPHARGDGPIPGSLLRSFIEFSPRPWGWSGDRTPDPAGDVVLPTPVGMVRSLREMPLSKKSSPHARGDGPIFGMIVQRAVQFSPRPWGWSALVLPFELVAQVLPTPVGMVRIFL